jgi:hypothetical protein
MVVEIHSGEPGLVEEGGDKTAQAGDICSVACKSIMNKQTKKSSNMMIKCGSRSDGGVDDGGGMVAAGVVVVEVSVLMVVVLVVIVG